MTVTDWRQWTPDAKARLLARLKQQAEVTRYDWTHHARPEQLTPEGAWNVWLYLAGRGAGKTRSGAEDIKAYGLANPGSRIAIVAPTYADARDTCVEGDSGLLGIIPPHQVATWNRSLGELALANGTRFKLFSGDEPERLRGPQHARAWVDELAAFRHQQAAWDQLMFGLRLGQHPQVVVTTTPKPTRLIRRLLERDDGTVHVTRGSTFDNAANLAPAALQALRDEYEHTRIGRQELYAELLLDTPGAKWTHELIEATRVRAAPDLARIVVAVDPSGGDDEDADEQGIIVAGVGIDGHAYILADRTCRLTPDGWARRVVAAYLDPLGDGSGTADRVVAERNFGGDMVEATIRTAAQAMGARVPVKMVTASRGKLLRAEPVAALYEQGRAHNVGALPNLEDQMTSWTDDSGTSPDRLDAAVMAVTELMLQGARPRMRFAS